MYRRLVLQILFLASFLVTAAQTISPEQLRRRLKELPRTETTADSSRAELLLELALSYVYKPGEYSTDLDSAVLLTREAEKINWRLHNKKIEARAYFVYAAALREKGDNAAGKASIESSLKIYKSISDPGNMAEAWVEKSRYYSIYDSLAEVREIKKCLEEALALFRITSNKKRQADMLKDLGDLDQILGNAGQAMKELNEALNIYKSVGHKSLHGIYDLMGFICGKKGDLPDAIRFGLLAVKTGEEVKDTTIQMCTIYLRLAISYVYLSNFDQALPYINKATSIAIKYNDRSSILTCLEMNCLLLSYWGRAAESLKSIHLGEAVIEKPWSPYESIHFNLLYVITYVHTEEFEKAKPYVAETERLLKTVQKDILTFSTFHFMVTYYLKTRQYNKAETAMSDYFSVLIPNNGKRWLARAYELKSQLDSARGNFKSALVNYQLFKSLTDSILNEASTFQYAQMEVEHETEKKDNDIRLQDANIRLLTKENELQQMQAGKSQSLRNMMAVALVSLMLLVGMVYNRYRVKQQKNRHLELKQHEITAQNQQLEQLLHENEWLLQEIHHRVKNNLQTVTSLLTSQMESAEKGPAVDAIRESRQRIEAIAMIHQRLYNSNNYSSIMMPAYVADLVENLREAFSPGPRIVFSLLIEPISLDISAALPAALILNEAISNAIKHAFPGEMQGTITVRVSSVSENKVRLEVVDDGIGFSDKTVISSKSFGIRLIKGLASDVSGESEIVNGNGTTVRVLFSIDHLTGKTRSAEREVLVKNS